MPRQKCIGLSKHVFIKYNVADLLKSQIEVYCLILPRHQLDTLLVNKFCSGFG